MRYFLPLFLLLLASPASARDVVAGYVGTQVQVRSPGEMSWRSVSAAELPANAPILNRSEGNWVEIAVPNGGRLQVRWNAVQQSVAGVVCPPGRRSTGTAGSQGLGATGC